MSSRAAQKVQAREARLAAERALEASAARRRRLLMLGGVLAAAAVIVLVAVLASQSGTTDKVTATERVTMFDGIPQQAAWLGDPGAKVVVEEYADPQCPFCADFATRDLSSVVSDYVRPGKVRMRMRTLAFLGPDSVTAARVAIAAGLQNRQWQVMEGMYANQGAENSGYVTPAFLRDVASGVAGLSLPRALAARNSPAVTARLRADRAAATAHGVQSTPTFRVGRPGGPMRTVNAGELRSAIDTALGQP